MGATLLKRPYSPPSLMGGYGTRTPAGILIPSGFAMDDAFSPLDLSPVAYWRLDEESGTRVDATGRGNDLTDNNTVTRVAGPGGSLPYAADFERDASEYLSRASTDDVTTGDIDYTYTTWVKLESKPAEIMGIISKDAGTGGAQREYHLIWNNITDVFQWDVYDTTPTLVGQAIASSLGAPALDTWYFIRCWHSATDNEVGIQVNNGTKNTAATTGAPLAGTNALTLGRNIGTRYYDGLIAGPILVKRLITDAEALNLYRYGGGS